MTLSGIGIERAWYLDAGLGVRATISNGGSHESTQTKYGGVLDLAGARRSWAHRRDQAAFLRGGLCTPLISGRAGTNQRVRVSVPLRKVFQTEVVAARARRLPSSDFFSTRTDASALSSTTLEALSGARRLPLEIALYPPRCARPVPSSLALGQAYDRNSRREDMHALSRRHPATNA